MMMELLKELIIIIWDIREGNPRLFRSGFIKKLHQVVEVMADLSNICDLFKFKDILCFQNDLWKGIKSLDMVRE